VMWASKKRSRSGILHGPDLSGPAGISELGEEDDWLRVLLAAVITTEGTQQGWIDQLRQADRLRNETRYEEAERAYIVARQQAETLGPHELPMAITLNHIGYQYQMLGRLREAERSYAAGLAIF